MDVMTLLSTATNPALEASPEASGLFLRGPQRGRACFVNFASQCWRHLEAFATRAHLRPTGAGSY